MSALVLESSGPVITVGADGRLRGASADAALLLGDDLSGTFLGDHLLDPRDATDLVTRFRRSTSPIPASVALVADAGEARSVLGRREKASGDVVIEFRDVADNRFAELTATLQRLHVEIRRRKRAEAELHEVLASTVSDLSNANERLAEFARTAAHDLRTPLTVMTGFAELLLAEHDLPEAARTLVERILRASGTCSDMVERMLVTARGDLVAQTDDIDLAQEVERLRVLIGVKELKLTHGRLTTVRAPGTAFRQVLLNLVTNAVKHRGTLESVVVHITARSVDGGWEVVVADSGPGIPEADHERVFEGSRLDHSTPGNGLGLSHCRRLATRWGGTLTLSRSVLGGLAASVFVPHPEGQPGQV